MLKVLPVGI